MSKITWGREGDEVFIGGPALQRDAHQGMATDSRASKTRSGKLGRGQGRKRRVVQVYLLWFENDWQLVTEYLKFHDRNFRGLRTVY